MHTIISLGFFKIKPGFSFDTLISIQIDKIVDKLQINNSFKGAGALISK